MTSAGYDAVRNSKACGGCGADAVCAACGGRAEWSVVDAVVAACNRELDAPLDRPRVEREAWAEGYTQACRDVLAALREAS